MPAPKSPPLWPQAFLDALARTGNVRVSAEVAGVDVTSAYIRRARLCGAGLGRGGWRARGG